MDSGHAHSDSQHKQDVPHDVKKSTSVAIWTFVWLSAFTVIGIYMNLSTYSPVPIFVFGGLVGSFLFMIEACVDHKSLTVNVTGKTKLTHYHTQYFAARIALGVVSSWIIYLLWQPIDLHKLLAYSLAAGFGGNLLAVLSKGLTKLVGR